MIIFIIYNSLSYLKYACIRYINFMSYKLITKIIMITSFVFKNFILVEFKINKHFYKEIDID